MTWISFAWIAFILSQTGFHAPDYMLGNLLAPAFGCLIFALAFGRGLVAHVLSSPYVVLLGEASYALYILHYPLHDWLVHCAPASLEQHRWLFFSLYLVTAVFVSLMSYRFVERPCRKAIRRWGSRAT